VVRAVLTHHTRAVQPAGRGRRRTADDVDTEEALAEFNFLMPDGTGKAPKSGAAGSQGKLLDYVTFLS